MEWKLKGFGRVDLDGTHRAILELRDVNDGLANQAADDLPMVRITHGVRSCTCILSEVKQGPLDRIVLDRFKQRYLRFRDGVEVSVRPEKVPQATRVELRTPSDFSPRDVRRLFGKPLSRGEETALYTFTGEARIVGVAEISPSSPSIIGPSTEIASAPGQLGEGPLGWGDIGNLKQAIARLREVAEFPIRYPELFEHLGIAPPKGIILHGPPGTGKTLLARALANETGAKYSCVSGPELFSKFYGETEAGIRRVFEEAAKQAPSILVIDELDSLVPDRASMQGELERRAVATFLTIMDGMKELRGVLVIGTTNRIDAIDPALRRGGRFEHEIHIGVPDQRGRAEILKIHTRRMPLAGDVDLEELSERTVGFVGADLAALCREAAYNALRRATSEQGFALDGPPQQLDLQVTQADFGSALLAVPPSGMREFMVEVPTVKWGDIGGLDSVKELLIECLALSADRCELLQEFDLRPPRGILLYGPPGTGKTLLAKAVANESGANFIYIKGPEIRSKWYGESEARIRAVFERARQCAPCIVFIDEIDAVAAARAEAHGSAGERVDAAIVNQILAEMDGAESAAGVFVMGATNRADFLDPALLRPGRFDYQIEVPLPDDEARRAILSVHLRRKPLADDVDREMLVRITEGFSGAEIEEVCREATLSALREKDFSTDQARVTSAHLKRAVEQVEAANKKLRPRRIGFKTDADQGA